MMPALALIFGVLLTTITVSQCATICLLAQPRSHNAPSGSAISGALHAVLATAKHGPCSGFLPKLPNGSTGNSVHRSTGSLVLRVERANATVHIDHSCVDAFNSIIYECIRSGDYWGGNATSDGVNYAIYNDAYPVNWTPPPALAPQLKPPHHTSNVKPVPSNLRRPSVPSHSVLPHSLSLPSSDSLSRNRGQSSIVKTPSKVLLPTHSRNGIAHIKPTSAAKFGPITTGAVKVPEAHPWKTETVSGVTGSPNSYSQTKTTDQNGQQTILPIWFDALGAAVIVLGTAGAVPGAIPPPAGFPPLRIGPDGSASLSQSQPPEQLSTRPTSREQSRLSTSSTRSSHSSSSHQSSSSAAPSASPVDYMISPTDGESAATTQLTAQLTATFGDALSIAQNDLVGVLFWRVPLTSEQKAHYESLSAVSGVYAIENLELDSTGENSAAPSGTPVPRRRSVHNDVNPGKRQMLEPDTQPNAPASLVDLSTPPPGIHGVGFAQDYYYDPAGGRGSTVYIIDTGANPNNEDYQKMPNPKRWIFAEPGMSAQFKNDMSHHGSCVLSLACGATYGVAKNANVVIVKAASIAGFVNGVSLIAQDIKDGPFGKIVVNMSIGINPTEFGAIVQGANSLMKLMAETYGVIFVCASGNHGTDPSNKDINLWPAVAASKFPLINVGAAYHNGTTGPVSQGGPLLTVTAVGLDIICAHWLFPGNAFQVGSGTSYAAPAVAGLAAYLLSVEKYQFELNAGGITSLAKNMMTLIKSLAYVRPGGTDPVIFNGYDSPLGVAPDDISTECNGFGYHPKRAACTPSVSSISPAAQASDVNAIMNAVSNIAASISSERAPHSSSAATPTPPRPVQTAALPPSEKQLGWGPSNPSACISSPGCDRPEMNGLFQQALSRVQLDTFYTVLTAYSSNFAASAAGGATTDGALITFQCTTQQDYYDANVSGADIYNAAQMIRSWPCATCGKHTMTNPNCTVLLGYCKAGDCNEINNP